MSTPLWYGCGYNSFKQIDESGQPKPSPVEIDVTQITSKTDSVKSNRQPSCVVVRSSWGCACFSSGPSVLIRGFCERDGSASRCLRPATEATPVAAAAVTDKRLWVADNNGVIRVWKDYNFHDPGIPVDDPGAPTASTAAVVQIEPYGDRLIVVKDDGSTGQVSEEVGSNRMVLRPLSLRVFIKAVSCGKEHVLLLSRIGAVFSYGQSSRGQCGHGDTRSRTEPEVLESLEGVSMGNIAAGGWHSVAISDCGDAYVWGWNESGQLGLRCKAQEESRQNETETGTGNAVDDREPVNLQIIPEVLEVTQDGLAVDFRSASCGSRHTALVDDSGILYTCGWNAHGQLAQGDFLSRDKPTRVDYFFTQKFIVENVTCGPWNIFASTIQRSCQ